MAAVAERITVDCSVVVKWKLAGEPHASESEQILLDWQHLAVELSVPTLLQVEIISAFLRCCRHGRILENQATDFIRDLLALPFTLHGTTIPLGLRAFEIARRHNQGAYDCVYVALAEQEAIELWTGDQRLYNALHGHFPLVRWIGDYLRKRP